MRIPWRELRIIGPGAERVSPSSLPVMKQLKYFQDHSRMEKNSQLSFLRHDLPHEKQENPYSWGPSSPGQVDWNGFDQTYEQAKEKEKNERQRSRKKASDGGGADGHALPNR